MVSVSNDGSESHSLCVCEREKIVVEQRQVLDTVDVDPSNIVEQSYVKLYFLLLVHSEKKTKQTLLHNNFMIVIVIVVV
jgi:hypothetical protein